jgi:hypothetical protein
MPRGPTSFIVDGIEPANDPEWLLAGESVRREFWRAVVVYVIKAKEVELSAGLDRFGKRLAPIKVKTRKYRKSEMGAADPVAPPLMPAYGVSRTRLNLTGRAYPDRAQFFWTDGWGRILAIHAAGSRKRHLPKRDVIGLSPAGLADVKRDALQWWSARRNGIRPAVATNPINRVTLPPLPGIKLRGDTAFHNYTFGIGTSGGLDNPAALAKLAKEGKASGFLRFAPGAGVFAGGGPKFLRRAK